MIAFLSGELLEVLGGLPFESLLPNATTETLLRQRKASIIDGITPETSFRAFVVVAHPNRKEPELRHYEDEPDVGALPPV